MDIYMNKKDVEESIISKIRSLIFGLEDGIISIWGLVLGVSAGTHNSFIVILAGLAGSISAALSMAAGDYLSSKSKREVQESRISFLKSKIKKNKESVLDNLKNKYLEEGFTSEEVSPWIGRLNQDDDLLLRKAEEEEGIIPDVFENPLHNALTIFFAFVLGSSLLLIPFFFLELGSAQIVSVIVAVVTLFSVGAVKTRFTKVSWWKSGFEMLIIGLGAAAVGFLIGSFLGSS
jgi:vacuolar iron transporter family protein